MDTKSSKSSKDKVRDNSQSSGKKLLATSQNQHPEFIMTNENELKSLGSSDHFFDNDEKNPF